jgi:hypothetical protein
LSFRGVRIWLKRLFFLALLTVGLYLLGVNLFLNTPLALRALNRHPDKFRMDWSSAWTPWPGLVIIRGLALHGHVRDVTWAVTAKRARGWIELPFLAGRTLRLTALHAEEGGSWVRHGPEQETAQDRRKEREEAKNEREGKPDENPHPWTLSFPHISFAHLRRFDFNDVGLSGDGTVTGGFRVVIGRSFELHPSRVRMPAARLTIGGDTLAQEVGLDAAARMAAYAPHDHPGLLGFDFLSGSLRARGKVPDLPFLETTGFVATTDTAHGGTPGGLDADLTIERGRLTPGSRFEVTAPAAGPASPFTIHGRVAGGRPGMPPPVFHFEIDARGLAAGRIPRRPPVFRAATLAVDSTTAETRLSRLLRTAQELHEKRGDEVTVPLASHVVASGVRIEAPSSHATLSATFDRAEGHVDLTALLANRIAIDGLRADGVAARLTLPKAPVDPKDAGPPWSVKVAGLHVSHLRELSFDDFLLDHLGGLGGLAGDAGADAAFSYEPDGTLAVERVAVAVPAGRFQIAGQTVAEPLAVRAEARAEPAVLKGAAGLGFLRHVSGTAAVRARIASLVFLRPYLTRLPWLALAGQGSLAADIGLEHGRLTPGARLTVDLPAIQAKLFESLATGRGTLTVAVASAKDAKAGAHTTLEVGFGRFELADLRQKERPVYIRGRGLRIAAVAPAPLDLASPIEDFDATVDLPDAEVPDLRVYNPLLPQEAGFAIVSGSGRASLHLAASTASNRTTGSAELSSDAVRVRFQNLEIAGRLALHAPLVSPDFTSRRFDLQGTRLALTGVSYRNLEAAQNAAPPPGWWARAELTGGSLVWNAPLALRGAGKIEMQSSGPLLALFAEHSRLLRWFDDALNVEDVTAQGVVRIGAGAVEIESLEATGGKLEVRSRMLFNKTQRKGDLYLRYGRLAAGIELRDGQRSVKLRRPLDWYEGRSDR